MINNYKISVIMSIYKEPREWLSAAIRSILDQSFSDFEFIIINDNPKQKENQLLLEEYLDKDDRIKIIQNIKNLGLTKSLNVGLKSATGEYIARMDGDDISFPERFKSQVNFLNNNPEYVACGCCANIIDHYGTVKGELIMNQTHGEIIQHFVLNNPMIHPSLMIRRDVLVLKNICYNEDFLFAQDYELIRELLSIGKIHNLQVKLLLYRKSNGQITSVKSREQKVFANKTRWKFITKKLNEMDVDIRNFDNPFNSNPKLFIRYLQGYKYQNSHPLAKYIIPSIIINSEFIITKYYGLQELLNNSYNRNVRMMLIKSMIK